MLAWVPAFAGTTDRGDCPDESATRSAPRRWRSASTRSASRRRISAIRPAPICARISSAAITATWAGSPSTRRGAATRGPCGRRRAPSSCSASITGRRMTRWPAPDDPERGMISVYASGRDYHDTIKKRLKALARWIVVRWPGELKVFRRHRAGHGKAAGAAGRDRLAGQAHEPRVARVRLVAVSRRNLSRAWRCRPTRPKPIIAAPAGAVSTSARLTRSRPHTGSTRGAASRI